MDPLITTGYWYGFQFNQRNVSYSKVLLRNITEYTRIVCFQEAAIELKAQFDAQTAVDYNPAISRLSKQENDELQHICGKDTPRYFPFSQFKIITQSRPVINFGFNMTSSQFVVAIGIMLNFPMDFSYGPTCTYVKFCNALSREHRATDGNRATLVNIGFGHL